MLAFHWCHYRAKKSSVIVYTRTLSLFAAAGHFQYAKSAREES